MWGFGFFGFFFNMQKDGQKQDFQKWHWQSYHKCKEEVWNQSPDSSWGSNFTTHWVPLQHQSTIHASELRTIKKPGKEPSASHSHSLSESSMKVKSRCLVLCACGIIMAWRKATSSSVSRNWFLSCLQSIRWLCCSGLELCPTTPSGVNATATTVQDPRSVWLHVDVAIVPLTYKRMTAYRTTQVTDDNKSTQYRLC